MKHIIFCSAIAISIFLVSLGCRDLSPVAHLPLDEGSGSVAHDITGNGHDGTLSEGQPEWITGIMGSNGLGLDGIDDYVVIPASDEFCTNEFSVSIWLKSNPGNNNCAFIRVFESWHMRIWDGKWDMVFEAPCGYDWKFFDSGYTFTEDQWHNFIIVVNLKEQRKKEKTITFYVDGIRTAEYVITAPITLKKGDVYLGQFDERYRWNGGIDDFQYFDFTLGRHEIEQAYNLAMRKNLR